MSENRAEILTGGLRLLWLSASWDGRCRGARRAALAAMSWKASFRSVEGVTVGTDVRLAGVVAP